MASVADAMRTFRSVVGPVIAQVQATGTGPAWFRRQFPDKWRAALDYYALSTDPNLAYTVPVPFAPDALYPYAWQLQYHQLHPGRQSVLRSVAMTAGDLVILFGLGRVVTAGLPKVTAALGLPSWSGPVLRSAGVIVAIDSAVDLYTAIRAQDWAAARAAVPPTVFGLGLVHHTFGIAKGALEEIVQVQINAAYDSAVAYGGDLVKAGISKVFSFLFDVSGIPKR